MNTENSLPCLSETIYKQIFHLASSVQLIIEANFPLFTIRGVNLAALSLINRPKEAVLGESFLHIAGKGGAIPDLTEEIETVLGTKESVEQSIFTLLPVFDSAQQVEYIHITFTTGTLPYLTAQVPADRKEPVTIEHRHLDSLFMQAPFGIALFKGIDYITELMNQPFCDIIEIAHEDIIGVPIFSALQSVKDYGFKELMDQVVKTGVQVSFMGAEVPLQRDGRIEQAYLNFVYAPCKEPDGTISGVFAIAFEVTEEIKNKLKLEQSEEKFRFLSECLPQQIWTVNQSGTVDFFNEFTQRYFSESNLLLETKEWKSDSENWFKYIHADDVMKVNSNWIEANKKGTPFKTNFRLLRGDGAYRWHLVMAHPVIEDHKIIKWLGTNTDIEDIKQIEDRKDEFISMASHELKTPMTSLKGYMQLISTTVKDENNRLYIDRALIQIGRIEKLIADLLDVSKITTGKIDYNMASFEFHELINETVQNFKLTNSSHLLTLVNNARATIYGDRYRFEQVLINFLSNAVKYSPNAGRICIKSVLIKGKLVVSIQDFGIGINKLHQSRLYERFYRVDKTAILFAGLGLGLYVSSEIINRHKGTFWYESTLGSGSEFYFSLPAQTLKPAYGQRVPLPVIQNLPEEI